MNFSLQTCIQDYLHSYECEIWKKLPANLLKVNVDGAVDKRRGIIDVSVFYRDAAGDILATMTVLFFQPFSPLAT